MVNLDENNGRMEEQTLDRMKRSLSIQEIFSKEWKLGLAALFCQKNTSKLALGLFITKKSDKIQAQAHLTTARRQKWSPGGLPQAPEPPDAKNNRPTLWSTARRLGQPPSALVNFF